MSILIVQPNYLWQVLGQWMIPVDSENCKDGNSLELTNDRAIGSTTSSNRGYVGKGSEWT